MRSAVLTDSASFSRHQGNSHTQQATSPYEYACQIMRHIVFSISAADFSGPPLELRNPGEDDMREPVVATVKRRARYVSEEASS